MLRNPNHGNRDNGMSKTLVFFRNDDVNRIEPGLREMTELFVERGIPVSHAVEPANLTDPTRDWLLGFRPEQVEIVQHGFAHTRHDRGEFGGARSAAEQRRDLEVGLTILREAFGDRFFPAMSFPFGSYNEATIPLLDELGYPVLSSHRRHQFSRQVFYLLGRVLGRGRWLGRHVSHHLRTYPGTKVLEVSVTISPIRSYLKTPSGTDCEFHPLDGLKAMFRACRRQSPVVGVVLHHRYHRDEERLEPLAGFLDWLQARPDLEFTDLRGVHARFAARAGARTGGTS